MTSRRRKRLQRQSSLGDKVQQAEEIRGKIFKKIDFQESTVQHKQRTRVGLQYLKGQ